MDHYESSCNLDEFTPIPTRLNLENINFAKSTKTGSEIYDLDKAEDTII